MEGGAGHEGEGAGLGVQLAPAAGDEQELLEFMVMPGGRMTGRNDHAAERAAHAVEVCVPLGPVDGVLMQVATQLSQAGGAAESLEYYRAALKKEPALFANNYYAIQRAFQQAGKADELIKIYEGMDFQVVSSPAPTPSATCS